MTKSIGQSLLPEFELEMASTRKVLAQIPDNKMLWKAHPKSWSIARLVEHIVDISAWTPGIFFTSSFNIENETKMPEETIKLASLLETFDTNVANSKKALSDVPDSAMKETWSLMMGEQVLFTEPKLDVYRRWVINHSVHHRAHLCVYLRLNDIAVPGMYGPSADDIA